MQSKKIVVTGAGGFIGFHLVKKLSEKGFDVLAIDSLQPSYGGNLSELRWDELSNLQSVTQKQIDLTTTTKTELVAILNNAQSIFHLAAFPGVRQGEINKEKYFLNNVVVTRKILDACAGLKLDKLFIASSSSIYGNLGSVKPVTEEDATGVNVKSFYAETKWQNELDAIKFAVDLNFPIIAARFFTVYGPYGRPDMAYWKFAQQIEQGEEINLYGKEGGSRNFTFVDDVVDILIALLNADIDPGFTAVNVAAGNPITTQIFAEKLGSALGKLVSKFNTVVRPDSDVEKTWANTNLLHQLIGDLPKTTLDEGLRKFAYWYLSQGENLRRYKPL